MIRILHREQFIPGDAARIWDFFATPRNLDTLTPPNIAFAIIGDVPARMFPGQLIEYRIGILPGLRTRWLTVIPEVEEGRYFVDEQRVGPYKFWRHEHHFAPTPDGRGVTMTDHIAYDVGWGPLGAVLERCWIRGTLNKIFDYRRDKIVTLFQ